MVPRALHQGLATLSTTALDAAYAAAPPMLVSHGRRDALVRVSMAERMRQISPASHLSFYEDAGHPPFAEDSARFNSGLAAYAATAHRRTPVRSMRI